METQLRDLFFCEDHGGGRPDPCPESLWHLPAAWLRGVGPLLAEPADLSPWLALWFGKWALCQWLPGRRSDRYFVVPDLSAFHPLKE